MGTRKVQFATGEWYHVYNRGTDKRTIFSDVFDFDRFLQSMVEFNVSHPIGSIYEHTRIQKFGGETSKKEEQNEPLVNIAAYCLNSNHYHFLLQQVLEKGIEKFMQRLGTGYTMYFNNKYDRSGALFQGVFKAIHVDSNEYLLHLSAYVNLNFRVHNIGGSTSKSSWDEYKRTKSTISDICKKDDILEQFNSSQEYQVFAKNSVEATLARRGLLDEQLLME